MITVAGEDEGIQERYKVLSNARAWTHCCGKLFGRHNVDDI